MDELALKFNFGKVTARQMQQFFKASKDNDYEVLSSIFATSAESCPPEWGHPNDVNTYMNRPFFTEFRKIIEIFVAAANSEAKN